MNSFIIYLFFDFQKSINHIKAQLQNILLIDPVRSYLFAKYYWMKMCQMFHILIAPKFITYYLNLDTNFAWHYTISIASGHPLSKNFMNPSFGLIRLYIMVCM